MGTAGWKLAAMAGMALAWSCQSVAAEWGLTPSVNVQEFHDDNLFLDVQNGLATWGTIVNASLAFSRKMENNSFTLTDRVALRNYDDNESLDSTDNYLNVNYGYNAERYTAGFYGDSNRESTTTSEIEDTGRLNAVYRVNQKTLQPTFSYLASPSATLGLTYTYQDKDYEAPISEFSDYTAQTLSANYSHSISDNTKLQAVLARSLVDTPDGAYGLAGVSLLTATTNFQLGFDYQQAENMHFSVLYGQRDSRQDVESGGITLLTDYSRGSVYNIVFTKTLERGELKLTATRDYTPSGDGTVNETDRANLSMRFMLKERHSMNLAVDYIDSKTSTTPISSYGRQYYRIQPGYTWSITESWALSGFYRYSKQRYDYNTEAADSNMVSVSIAYVWPYHLF